MTLTELAKQFIKEKSSQSSSKYAAIVRILVLLIIIPLTIPLVSHQNLAQSNAANTSLIANGSFENTGTQWLSPWFLSVKSGAAATISQDNTTSSDGLYSTMLNITQSSSSVWLAQLSQPYLSLTANQPYTLSYTAKASANRSIKVIFQQANTPYTIYFTNTAYLTGNWQTFTSTFTPAVSDPAVSLRFQVANATGKVWIDNVSLVMGTTPTPTPTPIVGCDPSAPLPQNSDPGLLVLTDNFESGTFSNWTSITAEEDATTTVDWPVAHSGTCSGHFQVSSSSSSRANITKDLPGGTTDVFTDGWFNVEVEGVSGNNVPLIRFFDGTSRIVDVYRQNISGKFWLRTSNGSGGWNYVDLGRTIALGIWNEVKLHVLTQGSTSTIQVFFNGTQVYSNSSYSLPTNNLTTVLLGSEHVSQKMNLHFDDVVIHADGYPSK